MLFDPVFTGQINAALDEHERRYFEEKKHKLLDGKALESNPAAGIQEENSVSPPKTGPFQAGTPIASGSLLTAAQVIGTLGLKSEWQACRLWCLGRLAGVQSPDGSARFFSRSVEDFAAAGMPGAVSRYENASEFAEESLDERKLSELLESKVRESVTKQPLTIAQQVAFAKQHGRSGFRQIAASADVLGIASHQLDESTLSWRLPASLLSSQPATVRGTLLTVWAGCHLRRALTDAAQERPHQFARGLLEGLFGDGPVGFNEKIANAFDVVGQRKVGYHPGHYNVTIDKGWNSTWGRQDIQEAFLNVSEFVRAAELLKTADRRAIVLSVI